MVKTEKRKTRKTKKTSLFSWLEKYLPHYKQADFSPLHHWLSGQLDTFAQTRGQRVCVIGPRGGAKSTFCTLAKPLQAICEGTEQYIQIISETAGMARQFLDNIKFELETNEAIEKAYPQAFGEGSVWTVDRIRTRNNILVDAVGTGGNVRSKRYRQHRPSMILIDDPQKDVHMQSALQREKHMRWLNKDVLPSGGPRTNILAIGTTLHRECIVSQLMNTPGWTGKLFSAMTSPPNRADLWQEWIDYYTDYHNPNREQEALQFYLDRKAEMDDGAELLWESRQNLYYLMCERVRVGEAAFNSEYLGNPLDPTACEWPPEYFEGNIWFDEWPEKLEVKTMALDPSKGSESKPGDYSAYTLYGRDLYGIEYVESVQVRCDVAKMLDTGIELLREFKPDGFAIETNQFQELLKADLERRQEEYREVWPIYGLGNWTNKEVRIRRHTPYLSQRKVRFKKRSAGTILLVDQLKDFPQAVHDDGPDSWEMARRLAIELYNGKK